MQLSQDAEFESRTPPVQVSSIHKKRLAGGSESQARAYLRGEGDPDCGTRAKKSPRAPISVGVDSERHDEPAAHFASKIRGPRFPCPLRISQCRGSHSQHDVGGSEVDRTECAIWW